MCSSDLKPVEAEEPVAVDELVTEEAPEPEVAPELEPESTDDTK